jgi:putative ABC transport system permease protein
VMFHATYSEPQASNIITVFENNIVLKNQYLIQVEDGYPIDDVVHAILTYFNTYASERLVMCLDIANLPSNNVVQNDIVQARQLTLVFPTLFFFVAVLVILTTLSQIILKERTQIGTMKALGLRKREIIFHYMSLAIVLCLIGIAVGFILGPFLIPAIMNHKYALLYSLPPLVYSFPFWPALGCAALLLFLASLVCYLVARKEVELTPAGSMRPATPKAHKELLLEKITKKKDGDMSVKMALRNIRVNFAKSLMVIVGVMGCTSLLVCGFGIDNTLDHGVEVDMTEFYASDMIARYYADSPSLKTTLEAVDGVATVEEFSLFPATISGEKTISGRIYLLQEDSAFYKVDFDPTKLVLSKKVATDIGAKVGDEITFTSLGNSYAATVGLIHETFYTHGIFAAKSLFPTLSDTPTNAWIDAEAGVSADTAKATILNEVSSISAVVTRDEQAQRISDVLSSVHLMTLNIKIFAVLLAVVVLYNLAMLNFKERYRDIATLRVLGFTRKEIGKSLVIEIMLLTVFGGILGLFLGLPTEIMVLTTNEGPLVAFLYFIQPLSYLWAIFITLGTGFAINLFLGSLTNRVPMVESLKSIE